MKPDFSAYLAIAIFLLGIGQLLILPPFEGLDEQGYYSGIRQVADTGRFPVYGRGDVSPDAVDYKQNGPAPFEQSFGLGFMSYIQFFKTPELQKTYIEKYRTPQPPIPYDSGSGAMNWQAQHPPLYFMLLAPVLKSVDGMAFAWKFFMVRCFSFVLACAGLMLALWGTLKYGNHKLPPNYVKAGYLLIPLLLPMFYPEFLRVGNDSLVIFLFGATWLFLLRWMRDPADTGLAIAAGFGCGLGLLAKTAFLPILLGFGICLLVLVGRDRAKFFAWRRVMALGWIAGLSLFIAGWWYLYQQKSVGSFTGSYDLIMVEKLNGGLFSALRKDLTPLIAYHALRNIFTTWSWYGTLSSVSINPELQIPLLGLTFWIFFSYACELRRAPLASDVWLPVWFCVPFFISIYILAMVEFAKSRSEVEMGAGWYMHVMAPAYGLAVACGLRRIIRSRVQKIILMGLLAYCVCFFVTVSWFQASYFAGCAGKNPETSNYQFLGTYCLDWAGRVTDDLAVIGWPYAAAIFLGAGLLCLVWGIVKMGNILKTGPDEREAG